MVAANVAALNRLLNDSNLSHTEFAEKCGIDSRTLTKMLAGELVQRSGLRDVAEAMHCEFANIVAQRGEPGAAAKPVNSAVVAGPDLKARQETLVVVPAAAQLPAGLPSGMTTVCLPLLVVGGKPVVYWQLHWLLTEGFEKFVIAVGSEAGKQQLERFLACVFPKEDVRVIIDTQLGGPGRTVMRALDYGMKEFKLPRVLVVLGDTISQIPKEIEYAGNWVLTHEVPDCQRWCTYERNDDGRICYCEKRPSSVAARRYLAIIGVYFFYDASTVFDVASKLDVSRKNEPFELSWLLNHPQIAPVEAHDAKYWLDVGHADRYVNAHAVLLQRRGAFHARVFNNIEVDLSQGTLKKSLARAASPQEKAKFINEIDYLSLLPKQLRILFPRTVSKCTHFDRPSLLQEYYPYPNLSDGFVFGFLQTDVWAQVFKRLRGVLRKFGQFERPSDHGALEGMYVTKTRERLGKLQEPGVASGEWGPILCSLLAGDCTDQGNSVPRLADLVETVATKQKPLLEACDKFTVIHGDFGFPNILMHLASRIPKLVDPRGSFGQINGVYGDSDYDLAKLNHSLEGYDFIVNDLFILERKEKDLAFIISFPDNHKLIRQRFDQVFFQTAKNKKRVDLITGLLFASMLPLHRESPRRQIAMCLTAIRLLKPFAEETQRGRQA